MRRGRVALWPRGPAGALSTAPSLLPCSSRRVPPSPAPPPRAAPPPQATAAAAKATASRRHVAGPWGRYGPRDLAGREGRGGEGRGGTRCPSCLTPRLRGSVLARTTRPEAGERKPVKAARAPGPDDGTQDDVVALLWVPGSGQQDQDRVSPARPECVGLSRGREHRIPRIWSSLKARPVSCSPSSPLLSQVHSGNLQIKLSVMFNNLLYSVEKENCFRTCTGVFS
ncbi:vasodilator-stimulated phosphoprotein-like [Herpailurus yagouaroundi]|uniref:vasodilator-stimulated phosphoprotein-like n=1 Tax=Herpailurus yagouaroundi TaxID=1608482 RepID=UPI001AD67CF9|nr:vasodilator-stimulated phosphoprotein-like [Puma yagouaroundi]